MNKQELLDIFKQQMNCNGFSFLAHLAVTGQEEAVNQWLADSPDDLNQAIYGYAVAGNIESMTALKRQSSTLLKSTKATAMGLAQGGHLSELHKIAELSNYKGELIIGHALAGNVKQVATLANRSPEHYGLAIKGYALAGHQTALLELVAGTRFYDDAIFYAAKAGHVRLVEKILEQAGVYLAGEHQLLTKREQIRQQGFINQAISGYCQGLHLAAAADLLAHGGNIQTALDGLKFKSQPDLAAYSLLLMTIEDDALYQDLIQAIKQEFAILPSLTISDSQIEDIASLRLAYQQQEGSSLLGFLTEQPSEPTALAAFELLDMPEASQNLAF